MLQSSAEWNLISPEIADIMQDYVSLQVDIDPAKIKAAALTAQNIDIKRLIGETNLNRVIDIDETIAEDVALYNLLIPAWAFYTYSRCLLMFQGTFTDSGYIVEEGAESQNAAKSVAKEMKGVAEAYMQAVLEYIEDEDPVTDDIDESKLTPRVRVFGGRECRASN